jgi:hypothetical protein
VWEPYPWIWALLAILVVFASVLTLILKATPSHRPVDFKIRLTTVLPAQIKFDVQIAYRAPGTPAQRELPPPPPESGSAKGGDTG